ncbi:MAG: GNAT family N-acetyltransferase [Alphaproteobacteria bacterium]
MIEIRQAGPGDDFAAILALVRDMFAYMEARIDPPSSMHRMTVDSVREHAATQEIWTAFDGKEFAACVFLTRKPECLYLGKMAVSPSYRGKGLARKLVGKAETRAHDLGLDVLELQVRIELIENRDTFRTLGFIKSAETAHSGYDRPTGITMRKKLRHL